MRQQELANQSVVAAAAAAAKEWEVANARRVAALDPAPVATAAPEAAKPPFPAVPSGEEGTGSSPGKMALGGADKPPSPIDAPMRGEGEEAHARQQQKSSRQAGVQSSEASKKLGIVTGQVSQLLVSTLAQLLVFSV